MLRWVRVTPLGLPVEPEVYMIAARSRSTIRSFGGGVSLLITSLNDFDILDLPSTVKSGGRSICFLSPESILIFELSVTIKAGSQFFKIYKNLLDFIVWFTTEKVPPAINAPKIEIIASGEFSR